MEINEGYWRKLKCEECCFTCKNNRNNLKENYVCNCEFENRNTIFQDGWCNDYEMAEFNS